MEIEKIDRVAALIPRFGDHVEGCEREHGIVGYSVIGA